MSFPAMISLLVYSVLTIFLQELQAVKRLLNEDRRRSSGESQKLFDVQTLFGQVS